MNVVVGTYVMLTIAAWSCSAQCSGGGGTCSGRCNGGGYSGGHTTGGGFYGGGGGPGNPCKYNPNQGLAVGCQNIDKCRTGDAHYVQCCLAVENCASVNTYVYKDNPDFFYYCLCGRVILAPCPKRSTYIPELGQCKHKDTGLLIAITDLLS